MSCATSNCVAKCADIVSLSYKMTSLAAFDGCREATSKGKEAVLLLCVLQNDSLLTGLLLRYIQIVQDITNAFYLLTYNDVVAPFSSDCYMVAL